MKIVREMLINLVSGTLLRLFPTSALRGEYQNARPKTQSPRDKSDWRCSPGIPKCNLSKLCLNINLLLNLTSLKLFLTINLVLTSVKQIQEPLVRPKNGGERVLGRVFRLPHCQVAEWSVATTEQSRGKGI